MKPIVFGHRNQSEFAAELDRQINYKDGKLKDWDFKPIEFLNESRQRNSILSVDNELNAPDTEEGHGDAFWSTILMLIVSKDSGGMMRSLSRNEIDNDD